MKNNHLQAPFPWFGGKSRASDLIWSGLGDVQNYVEPFAGSLAVLLGAPKVANIETVNDLDGFVANFWRAVVHKPEETVHWADWPVNENDLHARHSWLVPRREALSRKLEGDPDYCDPKIAGWWVWGICCWIGSGWCSGNGPWSVVDGEMVKKGRGVNRQLPHLGDAGRGVNRQLPDLRDKGVHKNTSLLEWFTALSERLRMARVCCGDWKRVLGPSPTTKLGVTGIVLDPPYSDNERSSNLYALDSGTVAADVRSWALEHGDDPKMRIALCGYDTEHVMPGWVGLPWKANGGYGSQGNGRGRENASRETVWFSPGCFDNLEKTERQEEFNFNQHKIDTSGEK